MSLVETESVENKNGEIVFKGTAISISILFNYLKAGKNTEEFLDDYNDVTLPQVVDVLELADEQLNKLV